MQRFYDVITDQFGNPANGVLVSVYVAGSNSLATIYRDSDNASEAYNAISNPFTTSPNGVVAFAAANGQYTINYNGSSITPRTLSWYSLNDGSTTVDTASAGTTLTQKISLHPTADSGHYGSYDYSFVDDFDVISTTAGAWVAPQNSTVTLELPRIVVIGDSIACGRTGTWGRLFTGGTWPSQTYDLSLANEPGQMAWNLERLIGLPCINHGIGGNTASNIWTRWGRDVLANGSSGGDSIGSTATLTRAADYVVLHFGINDVISAVTADNLKSSALTLINSAVANGIPIVVNTIGSPSTAWSFGMNATSRQVIVDFNDWLMDSFGSSGNGGVLIADYHAFTADPANQLYGNPASGWFVDGLHPTEKTYERWSRQLYKEICDANFIKTPRRILIDSAFDLTNPLTNVYRPSSIHITSTPSGLDAIYGLDNVETNSVPFPQLDNPPTSLVLETLAGVAPTELPGNTGTYIGITGISLAGDINRVGQANVSGLSTELSQRVPQVVRAYGDGLTSSYGLVRFNGNDTSLIRTDWRGTRTLSTTYTTNTLPYSDSWSSPYWGADFSGGGSVAPTLTPDFTTGPDGVKTCGRVQFTRGATGFSRISRNAASTAVPYIFSVWLKANSGGPYNFKLRLDSTVTDIVVTSTWTRYTATCTGGATQTNVQLMLWDNGTPTSLTADLLVARAQFESGASATDEKDTFVETTTLPDYWSDGGVVRLSHPLASGGTLRWSSSTIPVVAPTVTGAKGGNAALTSLCTQLASLGLIVDSTT